MLTVKKLNVVLDIEDEELDKYMNLGYNLIDERGNVIKKALPTDITILQSEYVKDKQRIAELEAELALLKANNTVEEASTEVEPKARRRKKAE